MTYHYIFHISTRNVIVKWRHNLKYCMFVWMYVCMDNIKIEILETTEVWQKICLHLVMISFSASCPPLTTIFIFIYATLNAIHSMLAEVMKRRRRKIIIRCLYTKCLFVYVKSVRLCCHICKFSSSSCYLYYCRE